MEHLRISLCPNSGELLTGEPKEWLLQLFPTRAIPQARQGMLGPLCCPQGPGPWVCVLAARVPVSLLNPTHPLEFYPVHPSLARWRGLLSSESCKMVIVCLSLLCSFSAEGEAGSMEGVRHGTRSQDSRIMPWAKGHAKPLNHPGIPPEVKI